MKITKTRLKEIIRQELKEFTTTGGGAKATQNIKTKKAATATKRQDVPKKKSAWDAKKADYTAKDSTYNTKQSDFETRSSEYTAASQGAPQRYRSVYTLPTKGPTPAPQYSNTSRAPRLPGYSAWGTNPSYTSWSNTRTAALTAKNAAEAERDAALTAKNTADSNRTAARTARDSAEADYETALSNMSAAEREEAMAKAATHFGFGAGAGGRAGGKGGTGKKGKKGSKKDESLFRILGRDLIKELNDIEKYK